MSIALRRDAPAPPALKISPSSSQRAGSTESAQCSTWSPSPQSATSGNKQKLQVPAPPQERSSALRKAKSHAQLSQRSNGPSLKPRKSFKDSLFNLFSAPNVERARGYTENGVPGMSPPVAEPPSIRREPPPSTKALRKAPSDAGFGKRPPLKPLQSSENLRGRSMPISRPDLSSSWNPPPLFQAYPQAVKYSSLQAPASHDKIEILSLKRIQKAAESRERSKSRPPSAAGSRFSRSRAGNASISDRPGTGSADSSVDTSERKVYVLVTSGFLLQYAGSGSHSRPPERILKLGPDSVAFASDLIPGKHWVLQVQESASPDCFSDPSLTSNGQSFLSKLGRRPALSTKKAARAMLMTFEDPEEMNSWMTTIRKEIEQLGGRTARPSTTTRRIELAVPAIKSPLSHRFVMVPKTPTEMEKPPPSPSVFFPASPTLVNSERLSGSTAFGALSDFSNSTRSSSARLSDAQKLTLNTDISSHPMPSLQVIDMPPPEQDAPLTSGTTSSYNSALTSVDECLSPISSRTDADSPAYANAAHVSLSRQPSMNAHSATSPTSPTFNSRRISTYNQALLYTLPNPKGDRPWRDSISTDKSVTPTLSSMPPLTMAFPRPPSGTGRTPPVASRPEHSSYFSQRRPQGSESPKKQTISPGPIVEDPGQHRTQQRASLRMSTSFPALRHQPNGGLKPSLSSDSLSSAHMNARRQSNQGLLPLKTYNLSTLGSLPEDAALKVPRDRTSFRSSSPIPLRTASGAEASSERTSTSGGSTPRMSMQKVASTSTLSSSPPSSTASQTPQSAASDGSALRRPPSMQVRSNRTSFLSAQQPSPPQADPTPMGCAAPSTYSKRDSVQVPIIRPPVRARRPSSKANNLTMLPPLQGPPPSRALPALPPQAVPSIS